MIDTRIESIIYQSQIYYRDLVNTLVAEKRLGKAYYSDWDKADLILGYLDSLSYRDRLTDEDDINDVNFILECLIVLCELNQYPVSAPIEFQEPPAVIVGIKGDQGDSITGPQGPAGLATDFQISLVSIPTVIDSFDITDAKAARWDYIVIESSGEQRAGTIIGHWLPDGSEVELADSSTEDLDGDTSPLTFSLEFLSGDIRLIATPASGTWSVIGTRYFIPNNGNGSGPITDVLPNGTIFIGNASNTAQSRSVSGVIGITNTGVTSFTAGAIVNADVNASAAIALTKLAVLPTGNRVLLSSNTGVITESSITNTNLASLDTTTSITTQLSLKLADPMTTIGDIIIRNGLNITARLGIGSANQFLSVSGGLPSWVSLPSTLLSKTIDIGDWNMDSTLNKMVTHGITLNKIRTIDIIIRNDADDTYYPVDNYSADIGCTITSTDVSISRAIGGIFDNTSFDSTGFNRGWVTIFYIL